MKIWHGYGSEHSANLVMIGQFETAEDAQRVVEKLDVLREAVTADEEDGGVEIDGTRRFSDRMREALRRTEFYSLGPRELEQFLFEIDWERDLDKVIVKTEEVEVSALLKLLVHEGARVEVFSAHVHEGSGYGRGE